MNTYKDSKQYRREGYDYSQDGFYFVTICTKNRELFFGDIVDSEMQLSKIGLIAQKFIQEIPDHFSSVKLDEYIIMPNHIHLVVKIDQIKDNKPVGTGHRPVQRTRIEDSTGQCPAPTDITMDGTGQCPAPTDITMDGTGQCPAPTDITMDGTGQCPAPTRFGHVSSGSLSVIVGSFKSVVTKSANKNNIIFAWQSRFHDRIIRNDEELNKIRQYIINNPFKWALDRNNPENLFM